ncbi:hypothetical protein Dred_1229 [Desulforamulus reducens MI-1]|uniref:Lipoprotein n=1 Tax=Desulforamulus reducens (strain ATCC BAA-1160 / DSM 100696 / MI-1) TaxID=349161 RepID=A4J3W0_DESRM|nr:hypothetical protein [Desulforamulus reducens]ABO49763.1 hypothetical protein Dred_1229 [Desulforamulus reducens MI-1]
MKKLIIIALLLLLLSFTGCASKDEGDNSTNPEPATQQQAESEPESLPEPNTSAMVDYIATKAKVDAKNINDQQTKEAIEFIKSNISDFFRDNKTMETGMYYGYLLEYAYKDTDNRVYAELGMDTYQAIKYVYRGAEKVEDQATQTNISQVRESLDAIE